VLVGRGIETAAIDELLSAAREGLSGALLVRGDAGIGKTALLEYAAQQADGFSVLRVRGSEWETELAYAALDQLLRPLLDESDRLPELQANALRGALGISTSQPDRFLVGLAVLTMLADAAEGRPVLCLLDDAHWFDHESSNALAFAARRLQAEGVVLLFGARDERHRFGPGIPELWLAPLGDSDAQTLLESAFGDELAGGVQQVVVESAAGNPLALLELPKGLQVDELAGRSLLVRPTRLVGDVERAYAERIASLAAETRTVLLLAAAEGTGDFALVARAAKGLDIDLAAIEAAEVDGLIRIVGERLEFRHPLVRSAAYEATTFAQRRRAHQALSIALDRKEDADRRAWHQAEAAFPPDDLVADELERTAERARARSGHAAAAAALERAARLSADDAVRVRRLVAAAGAAWEAGRAASAQALADEAEPRVDNDRLRAELLFVRASVELTQGRPPDAHTFLLDAADAANAAQDLSRASAFLALAAQAAAAAGDLAGIIEACRRVSSLGEGWPSPARAMLMGLGAFLTDDFDRGIPLMREAMVGVSSLDDPRALAWGSTVANFLGDDEQALTMLSKAIAVARARGALAPLSHAIHGRGSLLAWQGRASEALIDATEGLRLAREAGLENSIAQNRAVLALVAALRGDEDVCRAEAQQALAAANERGLALTWGTATWAVALAELAAGRWEAALGGLEELAAQRPGQGHPWLAFYSVPDLVEAATRTGNDRVTHEPFARLVHWADRVGATWADPLVARCRALLSAGEEATAHFENALLLAEGGTRDFQRARTELCFGEHLRREREKTEARSHLRSALAAFERLGARPWADRAANELRATGEQARRRDPSTLGELTPQELQIARLVADGATNREVAAQLFVSPKTVEYHLHKVFGKLGVASRRELTKAPLGEDALLAPTMSDSA
jgi:DNA-binding CsgD family transcriptional regulator